MLWDRYHVRHNVFLVTYNVVVCLQLYVTSVQHPSSMICDVYSRFLHCQRLGIGEVWQGACFWVRSQPCQTMAVCQVMSVTAILTHLSCVQAEICVRLMSTFCICLHTFIVILSECDCYTAAVSHFAKFQKCMSMLRLQSTLQKNYNAVCFLSFNAFVRLSGRTSSL